MKSYYIITNISNKEASANTDVVVNYLLTHGATSVVRRSDSNSDDTVNKKYKYTNPDEVPTDTEAILVLGGDGTMLQAARDLVERDIPIIGINFGALGFLAEIERDNVYETLDKLLNDDYSIEHRMMLTGQISRKSGEILKPNTALNDIVINRSGALRIIDFQVSVNGQYLCRYRADGIIISTPSGSTAYNMSAGGPIVKPSASLIVVTPICPHTLNSRSIILDADDEIVIEILPGKRELKGGRIVVFDGDDEMLLGDNDKICIKKSSNYTKVVKINSISFLQVLRRKMSTNEDSETK